MRSYWMEPEIAAALGVTARTVRNRARREGWFEAEGGRARAYAAATLPDDVRLALTRAYDPQCAGGCAEGCAWRREAAEAEAAAESTPESRLAAYTELSDEKKRVVDARIALLKSRDAFCAAVDLPLKRGSQVFCAALGDGRLPADAENARTATMRRGRATLSWATLCRWQKALEDIGPAGLAPGYKAPEKGPRIPEHMQKFIQSMRVDHPHAGATLIRKGLAARFAGQRIPRISAVRRYLAAWEAEQAGVLMYLRNPDEFRSRLGAAVGDAGQRVERLNQVWEYDSTPADVMCTDGRHAVLGVIDVYSRRAKLLVSPTSRATAIAALTRRALLGWGVPEEAHTDNGSDYVSRHMVRVFESLGVRQVLCPPFTPEKKPFIERFFGTWSHSIVELLPGYIGHSVADRKAIEARRSFAARMMQRGGDPVEVQMSGRELQVLCDRWIDACYHQETHSQIGCSPAEAARAWAAPVRRIRNERALDILLAPAAGNNGLRTIGKKGIQVDNAWYAAPEFAGHEGREVLVLEDATDFGGVYVFAQNGAFIARAVCPERAGIDRAELAAKVKATQKRVVAEGAAHLRALAREMKTRTIHQEILEAAEKRLANVRELPRRGEDYSTSALEAAAEAVEALRRDEIGPQPAPITPAEEARAQEVIDLADARGRRRLPATEFEVYEFLRDEASGGLPLTENEVRWIEDYEVYQETGKRRGLLAAGFRPLAERNRAAADRMAMER